ncbi:MAG: ATP-dependent helicase RecQ [Solirubrobacteraceae bacterium]|jgi:RecQ family ATP-dependent DNA helicase|nr:ATP-dependent helicase RecQ [Solirubrobacteraceae bacterium]
MITSMSDLPETQPDGRPATPEQLLAGFGLARFRPGQREAVQAALEGRDSLVVMPTGGGKSLCYQLPAMADIGLVVVVSPLIALMSDQLRRLEEAGVRAAMLASGMADGHNESRLREIEAGETQLVLAAPERFASGAFRRALASRRVGLFVVDEAHCVAEWGHDFRPDYLRLGEAIESLGRPAVMAATATATPRVAAEIASRLGLREPVSIRSGFDRPNLTFDVASVEGKGAVARKRAALMHALSGAESLPAIVYCGTRKDTDSLAGEIAASGISAVAYHAGLTPERRRAAQEDFMSGRAEVVVATNAFGMGVDKADVRTVAHWALPTSLEAYYQEAGRGGRDGRPGRALLLASRMDLGRLIRFIKERETSVEDVRSYVGRLRRSTGGGDAMAIGHGELGERDRVLLSIAERAGAVELEPGGPEGLLVRLTGQGSPRMAAAAIRAARDRGWEAYRSIERYSSDGERCRRRQILDHFGDEEETNPSGRCCDVCDPDPALAAAMASATSTKRRGSNGRARGAVAEVPEFDVPADQFDALRAWRLERSEGKPAYTVATDASLRELLHRRPRSVDELIEVRGIGKSFCEKHGESVLATLGSLTG